jgi:hypothetical protein
MGPEKLAEEEFPGNIMQIWMKSFTKTELSTYQGQFHRLIIVFQVAKSEKKLKLFVLIYIYVLYSLSQLKQVSRIKQKLKNNLKFFVVDFMCGTLSLYAIFFRIL